MPSKYVIREYKEDGYYHVFNRGVEKRIIFMDEKDYRIFLYYLFIYLTPLKQVLLKYPMLPIRLHGRNLSSEIELLAYCLLPNHFHLLVHQKSVDGVSKLLKQLTNAYTRYFNEKYDRVGSLVQGRFKAALIEKDELLIHIARYIHLNPLAGNIVKNLNNYQWSSYPDYIDLSCKTLCNRDLILSFFPTPKEHIQFTLDQINYGKELERIKHIALDFEE